MHNNNYCLPTVSCLRRQESIKPFCFVESGVKPVVQEGLGIVDFYPSNRTAVIWISEEIIITNESSIERKLNTFAKV